MTIIGRAPPGAVVGIDASATACAVVVVPVAWDGAWHRIEHRQTGYSVPRAAPELARIRRLERIHAAALAMVRRARSLGPVVAGVEGYAYSQQDAAHTLGEVGGAVRLALLAAEVRDVLTPAPNSARSLLLECVPTDSAGAKAAVRARLLAEGAPRHWSLDTCDAFAVANWVLAELGLAHVGRPPGAPVAKKKRQRRARSKS